MNHKLRYHEQKHGALARSIPFLLSYDQWLKFWQGSGHLYERGCRRGQYVMARFGDKGPYSVDNVKIITAGENHRQVSSKIRSRNAKGNKGFTGRHHSESTKAKMRATRLANLYGAEQLRPAPQDLV